MHRYTSLSNDVLDGYFDVLVPFVGKLQQLSHFVSVFMVEAMNSSEQHLDRFLRCFVPVRLARHTCLLLRIGWKNEKSWAILPVFVNSPASCLSTTVCLLDGCGWNDS